MGKYVLQVSFITPGGKHGWVVALENGHNLVRHFRISGKVIGNKDEIGTELLRDEALGSIQ